MGGRISFLGGCGDRTVLSVDGGRDLFVGGSFDYLGYSERCVRDICFSYFGCMWISDREV